MIGLRAFPTSLSQISAVICLACMLTAPTAFALNPGEALDDAALEKRARALSLELRCLVCQNQSIDDSDAPLAQDLRALVRKRLQAGDTDDEIRTAIVARYGEFVLFRPVFGWHTAPLWLTPLLLMLFGLWLALRKVLRRQGDSSSPPDA
ncbi:MAG: cytochrome c-type biogenesis protein [Parvibaculales bacterium]